jgi:hypothetical protein
MLLRHSEHFKLLKPQSAEMRALATMVEQRRRLVGERIRITNRLLRVVTINDVVFCTLFDVFPARAAA